MGVLDFIGIAIPTDRSFTKETTSVLDLNLIYHHRYLFAKKPSTEMLCAPFTSDSDKRSWLAVVAYSKFISAEF